MTTTPDGDATDRVEVTMSEYDRRDWRRHPVDVARLVLRLLVLGLVLGVTAAFPTALTNLSADLVRMFVRMPLGLRYLLVGIAQLAVVLIPLVVVGWLLKRHARRAVALVVGAGVLGGLIMLVLTDWLQRAAPPTDIGELPSNSFLPTDVPSAAYLAALVAGATTASPMMEQSWRKIAWAAVWTAAVVRVFTATQAPVSIAVTLALGSVIGSAALVAFGSPQRRPGSATLRAGLAAAGFRVDVLGDESRADGVRGYRGRSSGELIDVWFLDQDDRDAEVFARLVRSIRVRDVDEQRLSVSPRIRAAQLATSTSMARRSGARVPEVLSVAPADRNSAIVATRAPAGIALRNASPEAVTDATLDDLWKQVDLLHTSRIAHRSLSLDHLYVDGDTATVAGLYTAILASSVEARAVDRAELLVSTALVVGVPRALDAAVRSVSKPDLVDTLAFIQLPALPPHARKDAKRPKHFVDDLRTALQERLEVEAVELAELERISLPKILTWVGFAVLAFFVLALVTNWSAIVDTMSDLDPIWIVPILVVTLVGTVGGAMSLSGSVVRPIALGEATIIMFGQSFLNRFTPMNAGGMAMRIRYLQKGGTDGVVATAAIGLTSAASGVVQVVFFAFFVLLSSSDPASGLQLNSGGGTDVSIVAVFVVAIRGLDRRDRAHPETPPLGGRLPPFDVRQDPHRLRRPRPASVEARHALRWTGRCQVVHDHRVRLVVLGFRRRHRLHRTRRALHGGQHGCVRRPHPWRRGRDRGGVGVRADRQRRGRGNGLGVGAAVPVDQLLVPHHPRVRRSAHQRAPRAHLSGRWLAWRARLRCAAWPKQLPSSVSSWGRPATGRPCRSRSRHSARSALLMRLAW